MFIQTKDVIFKILPVSGSIGLRRVMVWVWRMMVLKNPFLYQPPNENTAPFSSIKFIT